MSYTRQELGEWSDVHKCTRVYMGVAGLSGVNGGLWSGALSGLVMES